MEVRGIETRDGWTFEVQDRPDGAGPTCHICGRKIISLSLTQVALAAGATGPWMVRVEHQAGGGAHLIPAENVANIRLR